MKKVLILKPNVSLANNLTTFVWNTHSILNHLMILIQFMIIAN